MGRGALIDAKDYRSGVHTWLPALLAIISALLIATGTVLRQRASRASGAITPGWWLGAGIALVGFGLQASALGLGSILLVQPLVVLAVLFALPLEAWADHRHPRPREWLWGGVLVACVATFLIVARPEPSLRRPDALIMYCTIGGVAALVIFCIIFAERSQPHFKALFYGVAAGTMFGVSALLIKTVIVQATDVRFALLAKPEIYLLIFVAVGAVVVQQRGFGAGDLKTSFPAMNVMEPAVAMVLGIILLGEDLSVSVSTAVILGLVLAIMIKAVIELAQQSAVREERPRVDDEPAAANEGPADATSSAGDGSAPHDPGSGSRLAPETVRRTAPGRASINPAVARPPVSDPPVY